MNAVIIQEARMRTCREEPAKPAIIQIDGEKWESQVPLISGEAQTYNQDARRIVEKINGR